MITKSITKKIVEVQSKEGCSEIYLFGSQVRGTANENSDIDIGVVGLSDSKFYSVHAYLEELLNKKIDFVELSALGSIIHSYYNGLESIFLLINKNIDKNELVGAEMA